MGLAANLLKSPVDVRLADVSDIPDSIDHAIYFADDHNHKMEILDKLLAREDVGQAIIFATTQRLPPNWVSASLSWDSTLALSTAAWTRRID